MRRLVLYTCFVVIHLFVLHDVDCGQGISWSDNFADVLEDTNQSRHKKKESSYDGLEGLILHANDFGETYVDEVKSSWNKLGAAFTGLVSNAANQYLEQTGKLMDSSRKKIKSGLNVAHESGKSSIDVLDKTLTGGSSYLVNKLKNLSKNYESKVATIEPIKNDKAPATAVGTKKNIKEKNSVDRFNDQTKIAKTMITDTDGNSKAIDIVNRNDAIIEKKKSATSVDQEIRIADNGNDIKTSINEAKSVTLPSSDGDNQEKLNSSTNKNQDSDLSWDFFGF